MEIKKENGTIVVYNNLIPFPSYKIINLFGVLFTRTEYSGTLTEVDFCHEGTHSLQCLEIGAIGLVLSLILTCIVPSMWWTLFIGVSLFYFVYLGEYLVRLFQNKFDATASYLAISFEREAYVNQNNPEYNKGRKWFAWTNYLKG